MGLTKVTSFLIDPLEPIGTGDNFVLGPGALAANTTGVDNTAVGLSAGGTIGIRPVQP